MKDMKDQVAIAKRISKYTECFDLLDRLGADNCIDPDDFCEEDMNDEMFKNLHISDIEDLFREDDYQSVLVPSQEPEDLTRMNFQEQDAEAITPPELNETNLDIHISPNVSDNYNNEQDSDLRSMDDNDDLQFMDFEEQMKIYEKMQEDQQNDTPRDDNNYKSQKVKIQGLDEVTERTEESD